MFLCRFIDEKFVDVDMLRKIRYTIFCLVKIETKMSCGKNGSVRGGNISTQPPAKSS